MNQVADTFQTSEVSEPVSVELARPLPVPTVEASCDYGTVVKHDDAALVATSDGFLELRMPQGDGDQLPWLFMFLSAVLLKAEEDEDWMEQIVGEFFDIGDKPPVKA